MARGIMVEIDEKGRVQIPATIRREVKTRRFTLFVKDGKILLEPTKPPATVRESTRDS